MKPFDHDELLKLDGDVPFVRSVPYGIQHILAMFVANLAPIMIIAGAAGLDDVSTGGMIQAAMLIAGIGTLIQLFPIGRLGSGLPIVMGISFTFVTVLAGVVATYGMGAAMGAIIVGGCIEGVLGLFARYWRKLITPHRRRCGGHFHRLLAALRGRHVVRRRQRCSRFRQPAQPVARHGVPGCLSGVPVPGEG